MAYRLPGSGTHAALGLRLVLALVLGHSVYLIATAGQSSGSGATYVSIAVSLVAASVLAFQVVPSSQERTSAAQRLEQTLAQLEETNRRLAAANEEMKELDRLKSNLLANVSHELRTPLTAIKGYTDYILDRKLGPINEKQEKGLIVVRRNLDRLARFINALLDMSSLDAGRLILNLQPVSLSQLLEPILTAFGSEFERKRLAVAVESEPGLPQVIADRERLSQVLENLLVNAVKFTPEGGGITVAATRARSEERPAVEIQVRDTGIGIPADQIGKIFERFHQVDGPARARQGGVGLGLAIVKSILEAHGSTITAESRFGEGTTFRFTLPLLEPSDGFRRGPSAADEAASTP